MTLGSFANPIYAEKPRPKSRRRIHITFPLEVYALVYALRSAYRAFLNEFKDWPQQKDLWDAAGKNVSQWRDRSIED